MFSFKKKREVSPIERFNPQLDFGLTDEQVSERTETGNVNKVEKKYSKSVLSIFVGNVCTIFNLLGLIVFFALLYAEADLFNFVFVLVYIANMLIGIIQELRAKFSIDKLSLLSGNTSTVIRNGITKEIPFNEIVLDDVIVLGLGNQVPTDCKILKGNIEVNEALLTGESIPVKKTVGDTIYGGSFIVGGTCVLQAVRVGKHNFVAKLSAKARKYKKPHSELMNSLKIIIRILSFIIVPLALLYFMKSTVILNAEVKESIVRTSTIVIGMIPSGMFLLTSLALSVGIIKLAKHHTLVQDLYSLEMLARVDTICFDKTGTITDGRMTVKEVVELSEDMPFSVKTVMSSMLGVLKDSNQTAIALNNYFGQSNELKTVNFLPFNSSRKFSAVSFDKIGTYSFGAPEFILSDNCYSEIKPQIDIYAKLGLRVLLLAKSDDYIENDEISKTFLPVALILLVDNIREDAIETIKWFKENDVAVKVISGDNPVTVAEVAKRTGIENAEKYISLEGLSNNEIFELANDYTVFGRVSPEQKAILVKALKAAGHVTAMTGDGVNDILALKEADCAITVASGSDSARNISNLVLLDNNFSSMPKVVLEGRRVINNVQSSASLYLMKTIFTILIAFVTLCLPYMKTYPFKLSQMNLLEVFVIGIPSFFLSLQPNNSRIKGKFINGVLAKSLPSGILMFLSAALIEIFRLTIGTMDNDVYTTMAVFSVTYSGVICFFNICKPFNTYKTILFSLSFILILAITSLTIFNGLSIMGLVKLSPFDDYWHHILVVITILFIDTTVWSTIEKICSKIEFKELNQMINKMK